MGLRLLILIPWIVYAGGIIASFVAYGPIQPLFVFGTIAIVGVLGGVFAIRGTMRWRIWALVATLAFLIVALLRHVQFATTFLSDYPSLSAVLNQYIVESIFAIDRAVERQAFLSLFMMAYHEWLMPLIQFVILILIVQRWLKLRSNPGVHTDAQDRGAPVTPTR